MSIFLPNPSIMGTGFIGRLNDVLWLIWLLASAAACYYVCFAMPVVALVDRMLLRRRRRMFGDERVWVKDLLAEAGRPALRRTGLPGRHRCAKQRRRQELLYQYVGWPFRRPTPTRARPYLPPRGMQHARA